jgi:hypothetical protein
MKDASAGVKNNRRVKQLIKQAELSLHLGLDPVALEPAAERKRARFSLKSPFDLMVNRRVLGAPHDGQKSG